MTRPQLQQHDPPENPSIQQSIINKPHHPSATNHRSPILNQPNQIIEMINDSSSPPTPGEVTRPKNAFQLPPLLNNQPTQTAHTMSSDHQRPQYQPPEQRRRPEERRNWQEPPPRPDGPASSHVFHLKQITVYSQPYSYTFNREPLYLQFGTHGAADAARAMQIGPPPGHMPQYMDPRDREDYRHYPPRNSRHFEEDRYEPYDGYQRNYESYDGTREYDRRGEAMRRSEEYEGVRYRHSTGQGEGPISGPGSAPGPSGGGRGRGEGQEDTEEYERDDESGEVDKRRQRLPTTRTYRDFSHVPSISGQSEEHKRYTADELRVKRARLNWSEDLHSKFLAAVEELGVENAVPTSIMKLMKVEGLTRENVASHLQKYRGTIKKEKEEQERRLLLKAAAKSVIEDGDGGKLTEEEVLKAVVEREESYKAPAKKRGGKDR